MYIMCLSYQVAGATLEMTYTSHNFLYDELNIGASLHYSLYGANLVVDYTMRNQSDSFNTSNFFSLGIVF